MFQWYRKAKECYAYLSDVPGHDHFVVAESTSNLCSKDHASEDEAMACTLERFRMSEWFERAWTLQELLAPSRLLFFDARWRYFGHLKRHLTGPLQVSLTTTPLDEIVSDVTGIPLDVLNGTSSLSGVCVAQKFSWLAKRTATRVEDLAYCMMGITEVNMPLLYGEGLRAWYRLQEAIIHSYADESIFAWMSIGANAEKAGRAGKEQYLPGLLADHPRRFLHCSNVSEKIDLGANNEYTITNQGIRFSGNRLKWNPQDNISDQRSVDLTLQCVDEQDGEDALTLRLLRMHCGHFDNPWAVAHDEFSPQQHQSPTAAKKIYFHATSEAARRCNVSAKRDRNARITREAKSKPRGRSPVPGRSSDSLNHSKSRSNSLSSLSEVDIYRLGGFGVDSSPQFQPTPIAFVFRPLVLSPEADLCQNMDIVIQYPPDLDLDDFEI